MDHLNARSWASAACLSAALALPATARAEQFFDFDIPAQSLSSALNAFAGKVDAQLSYPASLAEGLKSPGVAGHYTAEEALQHLLQGTGISYRFTGNRTVTLEKPATVRPDESAKLSKVMVTAKADYDPLAYRVSNSNTASKTDTPIMETPFSIQVVPQQVLKDQQAWRVEDAVKNVSNVQQVQNAGGQYQDFVIRGFGTQYSRFRNGIRLPELTFDMANVEQVEVLKGPAAMLYGRIEPGGMVNVVTRKPQDTPYYSLQQQFGSFDFYRTTVDATGPVTQDGSLSYRFDLGYLSRNSFRDFVQQNQVFVAPALHWQATPDTEFNLNVEYLNQDPSVGDTGLPAIGKRVANVPISRNFAQPGPKFNNDHIESTLVDFNWSHRFNADWKISNGIVANTVAYNFREVPVAYFQTRLEGTANPQVRRGLFFEDYNRDSYTTYLNLNGKFDTGPLKHNVLVGGDYYSKELKTKGVFGFNAKFAKVNPQDFFTFVNLNNPVYPNLSFNFFDNLRKNAPNDFGIFNTSWYGLYFQDQISFFDDKVHVLGGGRYDWAREVDGTSTSIETATPGFDKINKAAQNVNHFSPRVGLLYRPWTWLSLYGNRVESFGVNNNRSATNRPLPPETSEQYEAGVKTEWFDGRLSSNLAYFHLVKQNILSQVSETAFNTIGEARSQGIEFDVAGQVTDRVSVIATYAYTDARITHDGIGTNKGHRLPNAPEHSGSTWLKYAFPNGSLRGLSFGVGAYFAGQRQGDNENSYQLPGYVRADTYAAYTFNVGPTRLTTQLNVNNVFDKHYFYAGQPYNTSKAFNQVADPLTVLGSVRLEY